MKFYIEWLSRHSHINWALVDQVLVSGSGFLTGILLARVLGLQGYGQFSLMYAVLLYVNTIQSAIGIAPMLSILPKLTPGSERQRYVGGIIALQLALSLVSVLIVGVVVAGYQWVQSHALTDGTVLAMVVLVFSFQLQDWLRRFLYANLRSVAVLITDAVSYGGQ